MKVSDVWTALRSVFSNIKYSLLALIVAVVFYVMNVLIKNIRTILDLSSITGFRDGLSILWSLIIGFHATITSSSLVTLIVISLLIGIVLSLLVFKIKISGAAKTKSGFAASLGIVIGVLAPGCAACGVGLAAVFGVSAATLSFLPFKGLEFSIIAIILLLFSAWQISKSIVACRVPLYRRR